MCWTLQTFVSFIVHLNQLAKKFSDVIQYLQSTINLCKPTILIGDFNQNALQNPSMLDLLLHRFSFHQLLNSVTTDYDSCLDHIYINFPKEHLSLYGTLESYYGSETNMSMNADI